MQQVELTIDKAEIFKTVESLLWKYGKTIDSDANYRQVYNVHSEHGDNAVDNRVLDDSWKARRVEVVAVMKDFVVETESDATTDDYTITLQMRSRWAGNPDTLKQCVEAYIVDAMMTDWLNVTAPSEQPMYANRLTADTLAVKTEIYTKGEPI